MTLPAGEFLVEHLRRWRLFLVLVAVLTVVRLALAPAVEGYVNRVLSRHADYRGRVGDIDINLWRGAYEIEGLRLMKRTGGRTEPFLEAESVDFSIEWGAMIHGALVGEAVFHRPRIHFVQAPIEKDSQTSMDPAWEDTLGDLFPFKINRIGIRDGVVHYRDLRTDPSIDLELRDVQALVENLTNIREVEGREAAEEELVATVMATGAVLEQGRFGLVMKTDPFATAPTFDLNASFQGLDLVAMNDFLRSYANLDVESGVFHLFVELAASQGRITGYLKPFFEGVEVAAAREVEGPGDLLQSLWENIAGGATNLLDNPEQDRTATRIPFEGEITNPQAGVVATVTNLLVHAFVRALIPGLDDSVDLEDVEEELSGPRKLEQLEEERERAKAREAVGSKPAEEQR